MPVLHKDSPYLPEVPPTVRLSARLASLLNVTDQASHRPRELQTMIWESVVPERSVVRITCQRSPRPSLYVHPDSFAIDLDYKVPSLLLACSHSRAVALKYFSKALVPYLPHPIFFCFDRDYLEIDWEVMEYFADLSEDHDFPFVDLPRVRNLLIRTQRDVRHDDLVRFCKLFSGLERLLLEEPEMGAVDAGLLPVSYQPDQPSPRHNWNHVRAPVMVKVDGVRPALEEWKPPLLVIGTGSQWKRRAGGERSGSDSDAMEWVPYMVLPSLEYVPRLGTATSYGNAIEYGSKERSHPVPSADEEHSKIETLLFCTGSARNPLAVVSTALWFPIT